MTVAATTARARQFPDNTLIAKDKEKVAGFAVYGPSRDEDLMNAGEVLNLTDAESNGISAHRFQSSEW